MKGQSDLTNEEYWDAQEFWHSYRLQNLSPEQFASVVGRILSEETRLVAPRHDKSGSPFSQFLER